MSTTTTSSRQSNNSSPSQNIIKSLTVYNVSLDFTDEELLNCLKKTYTGVQNVARMYGRFGQPLDLVRVDFELEAQAMKILNCQYILINNEQYNIRAYRSPVCHRCQTEGHYASECPQRPLTREHCMELLDAHTAGIEGMMKEFKQRWDTRLSSLTAATTNHNVAQLVPIFRDLKTTCQQLNQQNVQLQQQLYSIVNRVESLQVKPTNGHA